MGDPSCSLTVAVETTSCPRGTWKTAASLLGRAGRRWMEKQSAWRQDRAVVWGCHWPIATWNARMETCDGSELCCSSLAAGAGLRHHGLLLAPRALAWYNFVMWPMGWAHPALDVSLLQRWEFLFRSELKSGMFWVPSARGWVGILLLRADPSSFRSGCRHQGGVYVSRGRAGRNVKSCGHAGSGPCRIASEFLMFSSHLFPYITKCSKNI